MAELRTAVESLTYDNQMMSEDLGRFRNFRDRVQALLPAEHLVFAPPLHKVPQLPSDPRDVYRVVPNVLWPAGVGSLLDTHRYVDLHTLALGVERASHDSRFSDLLHVRLQYKNGESRYVVSPMALELAKDNQEALRGFCEMVSSQLLMHLARHPQT